MLALQMRDRMDMVQDDLEIGATQVTLGKALQDTSMAAKQLACDLGAEAVAVYLLSGRNAEVSYFWSRSGETSPAERRSSAADLLRSKSVTIAAGDALAETLRTCISKHSRSFL